MLPSLAQHRRKKSCEPVWLLPVALLLAALPSMFPATCWAFPAASRAASPAEHRTSFSTNAVSRTAFLLQDGAAGRFHQHTLLEASLVAGGVENVGSLERFSAEFQRHREKLAARLVGQAKHDRGRIVWRYLHARLLRGAYVENQTRVEEILQSGDFNCLSACVLFTCLCREFSVDVEPCMVRGHIFCRLPDGATPGGGQIVELTANIESGAFLDSKKTALLDPIYLQPTRQLSDTQLIAKIFYNRAAYRSDHQQFPDANTLYEASLQLDPEDKYARENLLANVCQWALALSDQGNLAAAENVLERAWRIDAAYGPLLVNARHIDQKRIVQLYREGRFEAALAVIQRGSRRQPNAELYSRARASIENSFVNRHNAGI